jgi:putative peptidoglycan lipid II flippase
MNRPAFRFPPCPGYNAPMPDLPSPPPASPGRAQVVHAAQIVSAAFILSRVLGLVRDIVIARAFGATEVAVNAYRLANRFPETIFIIVAGGALSSAFIPVFAGYFARDDAPGGWRLFSSVLNLALLLLVVIAAIVGVFAEAFLLLYLPDLADEPALLAETIILLRILLLSTVIFGASGIIMGALNARQHFLLPALAPSVYNLGIIGGALLAPLGLGIRALAWGAVAGAAGHLLIQLPGLRQQAVRYSAVFTLRDRGVRQVLRLMGPRVLGLSFSQINNLLVPVLTHSLFVVAAIDYAWRIVLMPHGILGQALGIAAFPTFAILAAQRELPAMRQILADTLRLILFLALPTTALLMALSTPLVTLAFERGAFSASDTALVAWALFWYAPGLVALAGLEVVSRAFYALEDTVTPVLAGAVQLALMVVLALFFSRWLFPRLGWNEIGGLALGISLSNLLETGVLLWLLRRRLGGIEGSALWSGLWRMSSATLLMGLAAAGASRAASGALWQSLAGVAAGGVAYLAVARLLGVEELAQLWGHVRRRLGAR